MTEAPFKSVNEMVTDSLREAILSGQFAEGEYLRQQSLSQRFGVSEAVIREALRRLEAEGLVEAERRKGARVSQLSVDEISELYELRILLEELLTRHAVPNCTPADLSAAERMLDLMAGERDPVHWLALNRDFHNALYRASNRTRLLKFTDELRIRVERYLRLSLGVLHGFDVAQVEHREILSAYRARDSERAAQLVGAHLHRTADMITNFLNVHVAGHDSPQRRGVRT